MERDEDVELRAVALRNAKSILLARQRAEEELLREKDAHERKARELAHSLAMLRATLEATTDGILVTDSRGDVTDANSRFLAMWNLSREEIDGGSHWQVIERTSLRFADPDAFVARVRAIYASAPEETQDVLELADGRVFERFSRLQYVQERHVGRVWSFRDITRARLAEEDLRQSEQELSEFFENASVGLHLVGPDGIILRVNRTELEMLGYSREEYVGHHIAEFHVDGEVIDQLLRRLHAGEEIREYEARMRCKDGSIRYVLINSNAHWRDGEFMNTRCFTLDITDRRQIEETRSRLAAIVEGSQDAIIGKTLDGEILSWNAGAERLLGYSAEEVIGQSIDIVVPADRIDQERHVMEHIRRGQRVEELETVRVARGGTKIDVSLTVSPIRDVDGRLIGASSIARDITARKRAEQTTRFLADASAALFELTDHEAALRRVAELAVPSFADWCIVDLLNDDGGARRLATVHSDSGLVQLADEIHRRYPIHSADMIGVVQVLRSGISEWSPRIGEPLLREIAVDDDHLRVLRELKLHSYISTPLRSRGRILGVVTFMTAESGREYTETDLALAEDLASRAGIAIENAALLAALREADRRKDEFLAMLAHELRNPLAPIRNAAQIIRLKGPPAPEMQWAREVIDRQVDQLNRLVDDLLDVSRITRGKIELRRARISLEDVINTAVEASRPLIEKWGHELVVDLPPDPIHLDADLARLAQAFLNLLNNAAKYTEQRGRISLTAGIENGQAVVRVADNGLGIPPEMLPRIFDMFTQVDRSRERSQDGLGIGLTLVRLIVGLHQGTVHAHSKGIGFGSEFVVRLPLAGAAASEDAAAPTQPAATALPERRILVVDDNADAADTLTRLLRMSGSEVLAVHDGLSAVGAASVFRPDVVLMDIGLPRLNGYEAARRIRQELGDDVLLIAVTGWGQGDDRRKSEEAGFDFHVTKPVSLDELRSLLAAADT